MKERTILYKGNDVTVIWKPHLCIHSGICWRSLSKVFDPGKKKWIMPDAAPADKVREVVEKCPSGALSYEGQELNKKEAPKNDIKTTVTVLPNGPLMIEGDLCLVQGDNKETSDKICLCRCGQSKNKPYCDGSHVAAKFKHP